MLKLAIALGFATMCGTIHAATSPGSPDPTFGTGGGVVVNPSSVEDDWGGGVLQPDGRLVVSGYTVRAANAGTRSIAVVRLLDDGTLDPSFGTGGIARANPGLDAGADYQGPALDASGRIFVAGYSQSTDKYVCALVVLRPDGTLDQATFVSNGVFQYQPTVGRNANCMAVKVQSTGKILLLGVENEVSNAHFLIRLMPNGSVDPTFSGYGIVQLPSSNTIHWRGMATGADDSIYIAGWDGVAGQVLKLTPDGVRDATFAANGLFQTSLSYSTFYTPHVLPGGGILLTGYHGANHLVMRLTAAGLPDPTFGVSGVVELAYGGGYAAVSTEVQRDGRILVGIRKNMNNSWRFAAARLNPNGSLDSSFGIGGLVTLDAAADEVLYNTALGADGKLWLIGRTDLTITDSALAVRRVLGVEITTYVVEFFNVNLNHYFITADPNEAAAIDGGSAGPGWSRTGQTFKSGGPNRVCRFYGSTEINPATGQRRGPNSHFYTIDPAECAQVKLDPGWHFESYDFNGWPLSGGACPAGTLTVKRVYNGRFAQNDSNHRYTTSGVIYDQMIGLGWQAEGTVFCSVR